ncbi:DUF1232 domain-containing protein [Planomonospora parontospora]|uniref:DUF1232 domain-containing protein n=1 Tax=Planomonospora parontospora TaxID=58119 RepID=UPI0019425D71|nr:DUF1232 domain-containing protein [Planomonospora parontospora]GGL42684.1 hypothetical protein GCM10014719_50020 [Planomonospora parontospora subsp. antibiotica]GII18359.1 hypothetical protein Ppa05_50850 [Planomonospora parontospora subsp. antibiotica]
MLGIRLWLLLGYPALPIDLIHDFIPALGCADDPIAIAAIFRADHHPIDRNHDSIEQSYDLGHTWQYVRKESLVTYQPQPVPPQPSPGPAKPYVKALELAPFVAPVIMILCTFLPWVSIDFIVSASFAGVRSNEGKVVIASGILALVCVVAARALQQAWFTWGATAFGLVATFLHILFAMKMEEAFSEVEQAPTTEAANSFANGLAELATTAVGVDIGWFLGLIAALITAGTTIYHFFFQRRQSQDMA